MKHKGLIRLLTVCLALLAGACTSTMLVSKHGKGYFLDSGHDAIYKMLCESGDLIKVLADTHLPKDKRDDLYRYSCGAERSGPKVREIFASLDPEQRKDLRLAFVRHGYDINYLPC